MFDTETTSTDPLRAELVGLSFAIQPRKAWYVTIREEKDDSPPSDKDFGISSERESVPESPSPSNERTRMGIPLKRTLAAFAPLFSNPSIKKVGQNIKYDMLVLAAHGVEVRGELFDTMIAHYVLRPDAQHNLDAIAEEHLRYKMIGYDELTGTGKGKKELRDVRVEDLCNYSAQDADITYRLCERLREKLGADRLLKLCEEIEFRLIPVLADMEFAGVTLDTVFLSKFSKELDRVLTQLVGDIHSSAGESFNVNSTQQLSQILFDKLKLPSVRKTKTGFSTDVGVLETLRHEHPVIEKLLEYRQLQKLKSTYVDALPALINPATKRLHTSFNQAVAATGRLSSSDPNLQNIPIRTDLGRSIRKAFIPRDRSMRILAADYSQIELRIMAHISGDEEMSRAFNN